MAARQQIRGAAGERVPAIRVEAFAATPKLAPTPPAIIGTPTPIPDNPAYETVAMALPPGAVAGEDHVFVLISYRAD